MLQTLSATEASSKEPTEVITAANIPAMAVADLSIGLKQHSLWWNFARHDIRQRFRRSVLGPFWLTLSMGVMIGALGFVFSQLFDQNIRVLLPYLAASLITWSLLTTSIIEGCQSFISAEGYIRNVPMPLSVHYYRVFSRNLIIWAANMVIFVLVAFIFPPDFGWETLLFFPGFALFLVNLAWLGMFSAILSTRFRDIPEILASLLQVVFFVTPIFWSIDILPGRPAFVFWNPLFHLLELVRSPLLGHAPDVASWLAGIVMAVVGSGLTILLYRRSYQRIPYWV